MIIPKWAPIYLPPFDKDMIKKEILQHDLIERGDEKTTIYVEGKSVHIKNDTFNSEIFSPLKEASHYEYNSMGEPEYVKGRDTFRTFNVTHTPEYEKSKTETWIDTDDGKMALWQYFKSPWEWHMDLPLLKSAVDTLPFEYVQMVRLVQQRTSSVGIVHRDSDWFKNKDYYHDNFGSITMNVSSGGSNLFFESNGEEYCCDDDKYYYWHFDDSAPHCTTVCKSERIQVRVFGKIDLQRYINMMDLSVAVW